jgi:hypothetical protein
VDGGDDVVGTGVVGQEPGDVTGEELAEPVGRRVLRQHDDAGVEPGQPVEDVLDRHAADPVGHQHHVGPPPVASGEELRVVAHHVEDVDAVAGTGESQHVEQQRVVMSDGDGWHLGHVATNVRTTARGS